MKSDFSKEFTEARTIINGLTAAKKKTFSFMNPRGADELRLVELYNSLDRVMQDRLLGLLYTSGGNKGGSYRDKITL